MAARAIWKGIIRFGTSTTVPVKLYAAVQDRHVHFRLLHKKDHVPVKQVMVNPQSEEIVPYEQTLRAYDTGEGEQVLLSQEELAEIQPEKSRDIEIVKFLPPEVIDHRWYDRPYYLGPDGDEEAYAALAEALKQSQREGLAHWVMRNKTYFGALMLFQGYPMLMSLRYADQVISTGDLTAPGGKPLDKRELEMAGQLVSMLASDYDPQAYEDEYRQAVLSLIDKKRRGEKIKRPRRREKPSSGDITQALEASLREIKHGQ